MHSITLAVQNGSIHILEADVPASIAKSKLLPVVFVHGMACSASIWDTQLAYAAQTRRAIAIDLRGHGDSTPPADGNYSPASCAADLFAVLKALKLEQIVLVGHSYGAQLVLVDPPIDCTQCPPEVYESQIAPMQAALTTDGWRSVLEESFQNALEGGAAATYDQILARLAATPKDPLVGTSRELFTFKAVEALDQYLSSPGARAHAILAPSNNLPLSLHVLRPTLTTTTLPATGHWLMLDAPESFAMALDTCLTV
jgi:pimeloyl-ACP methyl ester carboxylesterase